MAFNTIYRIINQELKFFSSEKSGFTTASEALFVMVNDLVTIGAMNVVAAKYKDSSNTEVISTWPVEERKFILVNKGLGYYVNDILQLYQAGNGVPFTGQVSAVSTTGAISSIKPHPDAPYADYTDVSITQPNPLFYAKDDFSNIDLSKGAGTFKLAGNVSGITGATQGPLPTRITNYSSINSSLNTWRSGTDGLTTRKITWQGLYGTDGSGGTFGSRWPSNSIIFLKNDMSDSTKVPMKGQRIFTTDGSSGIPNDTIITEISAEFDLYNDVEQYPVTNVFYAVADKDGTKALRIKVNNPITLLAGTEIGYSGRGATMRNDSASAPDSWSAVLESLGAVDPLSDSVGVLGNVTSATTNSNLVQVSSLTQSGVVYNPNIYVGQTITNYTEVGDGVEGIVTVVNVAMTSTTTANVTLSSQQTLSAGKTLKFAFDPVQKYRLLIDVLNSQQADIYAATATQLTETCIAPNVYFGTETVDKSGRMGAANSGDTISDNKSNIGFINRSKRVSNQSANSVPLNTQLSVTDRGIFFGVWEGNFSVLQKGALANNTEDHPFNWFLIQRPVDRITGRILTTGRAPLFCINSVGYEYYKFIVRESDVFHPTLGPNNSSSSYRTVANKHSDDSFALLNTTNQVALTEDSKYLISFIHNLTTPRFRYTEELDMIGQTSADVCMNGNDISITAYQESGPRIYKALPSNKPYNTGLRIVVIKDIS